MQVKALMDMLANLKPTDEVANLMDILTHQPKPVRDPSRQPIVFPYCRTSDTHIQDNSMENQVQAVRRLYDYKYRPIGFRLWEPFQDHAISGKVAFANRPAGSQLWHAVRPGDVIAINKLDRGFRDTFECLRCENHWASIGVTLVLIDIGLDTSTPIGKMMMTVMAAVAEFERRRIVERQNEVRKIRKNHNLPINAESKLGWKLAGPDGKRHFVPDHYTRSLCFLFLDWFREGLTYQQVHLRSIREGVKYPKHRRNNLCRADGFWGLSTLTKAIAVAAVFDKDGQRHLTEEAMKPKLKETA